MPKPGQHPPLAEQLDELIGMIQTAELEESPAARRVAEKGREVLKSGRELMREIAEATRQTAMRDVDIVAAYVRERPLTSVAIAGAAGAMLVCLMPRSRRHRRH